MGTSIILGQGYVGLPLAEALTEVGESVLGFDVNERLVENLNSGKSHVDDITDDGLGKMISRGYRATSDPADIAHADTVVICVPTPLNNIGGPDMSYVESASAMVAANLKPGALVILESTTYPGTTTNVLRPLLEEGGRVLDKDFYLAFSPERIDPGNQKFNIRNTPKIVGGESEVSGKLATAFYTRFVSEIHETKGTKEAETAKLLENTYRHVNIALINELAMFCNALGIDVWEVVKAASSKPYGFQPFYPGPGVGGHCIPVDPAYLSFEVKRRLGADFRFIETAMDINNGMPRYVVSRIQAILNREGKPLKGSKVLLLGMTYKPDIADMRESPSLEIFEILLEEGAEASFFDPHAKSARIGGEVKQSQPNLQIALDENDVVILLQAHKAFDLDAIVAGSKSVFDTRGILAGANVERL
ncbi:MAG: nucleotide sugar dehydrogenase [Microbacteriaceae bacterium]|nr:nucleotide sugar dehydrogenase [Microbacteriaceae bacterium]